MEWRYLCNSQQENNNKKIWTTHIDKLKSHKYNETEIEILNNMYQKSVAAYISDIIPKY